MSSCAVLPRFALGVQLDQVFPGGERREREIDLGGPACSLLHGQIRHRLAGAIEQPCGNRGEAPPGAYASARMNSRSVRLNSRSAVAPRLASP